MSKDGIDFVGLTKKTSNLWFNVNPYGTLAASGGAGRPLLKDILRMSHKPRRGSGGAERWTDGGRTSG